MNPARLLQHFDRIAEAPDAIPRLRRFILDLAVRGKLVEQDPNDEPAAELLKRIQAEKALLVKEGTIRRENSLPPISEKEKPFELPPGWQWARFIDYALDISTGPFGSALHQSDYVLDGVPLVNPSHMINARIWPDRKVTVSEETANRLATYRLSEGDIVMARRGEVGRAAMVSGAEEGWLCGTGSFFLRFQNDACREYIILLLRCEPVRKYLAGEAVGITMVNLNHSILKKMPLAIPPLAEQHRIVAKVDELMALCDQLEAAKTEREQSRDRLVAASLHRLNPPADAADANTPEAFRDHARFIFNHLPCLTTRPEHIKQLRQTILNLAVRGKLVPQDPNDESVAELLGFVLAGRSERETPFLIPKSWAWVTVGEIAQTRLGKMLDKAKNKGTPRRYLRNVNVRWFDFDLSDILEMRFEDSELEEFALRLGDVLICEGGEPGRAAVWDERDSGIYFQKAIHRVRFPRGVNPHYFASVLREAANSRRLDDYFTGVGIKHFTGKGLSSFLVPLPPLAEQHRIVAKVNELMALCDQLETQLTTTEADSRRLLEAVLHEALAPALEEAA